MELSTAILFWFCLVIGWTYVISVSAIGWPVRLLAVKLGGRAASALIYCTRCSSFWVGVALAMSGSHPFADPTTDVWTKIVGWGAHGFCAVGVVHLCGFAFDGYSPYAAERRILFGDAGEEDTASEGESK